LIHWLSLARGVIIIPMTQVVRAKVFGGDCIHSGAAVAIGFSVAILTCAWQAYFFCLNNPGRLQHQSERMASPSVGSHGFGQLLMREFSAEPTDPTCSQAVGKLQTFLSDWTRSSLPDNVTPSDAYEIHVDLDGWMGLSSGGLKPRRW
jgi:hypothetical protein